MTATADTLTAEQILKVRDAMLNKRKYSLVDMCDIARGEARPIPNASIIELRSRDASRGRVAEIYNTIVLLDAVTASVTPEQGARLVSSLTPEQELAFADVMSKAHEMAARRCPGLEHRDHVADVCEGSRCTACGGPIDGNEECRCG